MRSGRTVRSETKCRSGFIFRPATPASLPSDEAGIYQHIWSSVGGKFKEGRTLNLPGRKSQGQVNAGDKLRQALCRIGKWRDHQAVRQGERLRAAAPASGRRANLGFAQPKPPGSPRTSNSPSPGQPPGSSSPQSGSSPVKSQGYEIAQDNFESDSEVNPVRSAHAENR